MKGGDRLLGVLESKSCRLVAGVLVAVVAGSTAPVLPLIDDALDDAAILESMGGGVVDRAVLSCLFPLLLAGAVVTPQLV